MNIVCIGGGPAGLYFAILMKKANPYAKITVLERNRPDDTYGWGVVFSDETLSHFEAADAETYAQITANFKSWRDIKTYFRDTLMWSRGHGFAAISRQKLLLILQERALRLGVELEFENEVQDLTAFADADLILASDGVNSMVRQQLAAHFQPHLDWRQCKFCWLGTDKPLSAFTFIFKEHASGLFQVHAYPFEDRLSTWIVECQEDVWRRAGLDSASEDDTVAFCEELFGEYLEGCRLFTNRSLWRTFPTVSCATWHHQNVLLIGDAAHTAHFSIGSGTKLAMEDAIVLAKTFAEQGTRDVPQVLATYDAVRRPEVIRLQKAAQTSLEWFENSARYIHQHPFQFQFNLMTRSKRITYDNLKARDPELVTQLDQLLAEQAGVPAAGAPAAGVPAAGVPAADEPARRPAPPPIFTPFRLRGLELANRIVVSPMCQYSAQDGTPDDWHLVHLGSRAVGGAGLVISEMTNVLPTGRITPGCTGMYREEHVRAWQRIVDFVHQHTPAKIGIQLAHAGRKGSVHHAWTGEDVPLRPEEGAWTTLGPSALGFYPHWPAPKAMDEADMESVIAAFVRATRWADEAGFDLIEVHMAHGYLLSSFISPLANQRQDAYGGSLENRCRFPLAVFSAMRAVWPEAKPITVRISASDWLPDGRGTTPEEAVAVARWLKRAGCDAIDVSSGGNSPESQVVYGRMYQVPFAEKIRFEAEIPVMAVGALLDADHANTVIAAGRADLAVLARPHLEDPYLTLHAAKKYECWEQPWPGQYLAVQPRPR